MSDEASPPSSHASVAAETSARPNVWLMPSRRWSRKPSARRRILELAKETRYRARLGSERLRDAVAERPTDMLTSCSDAVVRLRGVRQRARPLATQAIEVERMSDDPPERVPGLGRHGLRVRAGGARSAICCAICFASKRTRALGRHRDDRVSEIERRTLNGDAPSAQRCPKPWSEETTAEGRAGTARQPPTRASNGLARRRSSVTSALSLRKVEDVEVERLNRLCHTDRAGASCGPLAEALAVEENPAPRGVCASCCSASAPPAGSRSSN